MIEWRRPLVVIDQWGPFKGNPPAEVALQADTEDGGTLVALRYGNGGGVPVFMPDGRGGMKAAMVHRPGAAEPYLIYLAYFPAGKGPNTTPDPEGEQAPSRMPTLEEMWSAVHQAVPRGAMMALSPVLALSPDQSTEVPPGAVGFLELRQTGQMGSEGPGIVPPGADTLSPITVTTN